MQAKKVGVLGSGDVGKVLAAGFKRHGYEVMIGSRSGDKLADWSAANGIAEGTMQAAAAFGEIVVLAVGGGVAADAVGLAGEALAGKVVIDACNPIGGPPVDGVLQFFTGPNESLMERLQALAPTARFVKSFSCVGNALMVNPSLPGGRPTMFICGDDKDAKATVQGILELFGWDSEDMGGVKSARAIEPLCQLWCISGFLHNSWGHAFKLLKP
ncbi:MAG: NAD(P)-binding domain-containing protein [Nannocystis sp.]|nr:NAD(P)-binding domain-containing protein [Nannocystis sp.]